jgi:tetratricopeptide (TPR) repeat protein
MSRFKSVYLLLAIFAAAFCRVPPSWSQSPAEAPTAKAAPSADFAEARRLMQEGKFDDAISRLQEEGARNPELKGLNHELGTAYYKKGDYAKAIEFLQKATQNDPADNEAVQLLGLSYYLAGRPTDAIPLLEKVQTWFPRANVDAS